MGAIRDQTAAVYRDYNTTGVPASGSHEPSKGEIRDLGNTIDASVAAIGTALLSAGATAYATQSALFADLARPDKALAVVYGDGDLTKRGMYVKSGGTGTGSWVATGLLATGPAGPAGKGDKGDTGTQGLQGVRGENLYQFALRTGMIPNTTSEGAFLDVLYVKIGNAAPSSLLGEARRQLNDAQAEARANIAAIQQFAGTLTVPYSNLATLFAHLEAVVLGSTLPAGTDFSSFYPSYAATMAALTALAAPFDGQTVIVTSTTRGGVFVWRAGNYVTQVAADTEKGVYAKADTIPATNGAWVRLVTDNIYQVAWFGTTAARTDNQVPINCAFATIPASAVLMFPAYSMVVSAACRNIPGKAVHVLGSAQRTSMVLTSDTAANYNLFQILSSNSSVRRMGFGGGSTGVAAIEPICLLIGLSSYRDPTTNLGYPSIVENVIVDDVWTERGDSGVIILMNTAVFRSGFVPDPASGAYGDYDKAYLIYEVTVRNCRIHCRKNGIAFYGTVDCHEYDNHVFVQGGAISSFSSGLRVLGSINLDSHNSTFRCETEDYPSSRFGIFYALARVENSLLANVDCKITGHKILSFTIPFEIESWQGGSLVLTDHVVRGSANAVGTYPVIRNQVQGDIINNKRVKTEGFTHLHIARIDAIGYNRFMDFFTPVKDLIVEGNRWISNAYATDPLAAISLRDLSYAVDADGNPLSAHGPGFIRILNNELLSNVPSFGQFDIRDAQPGTRVIVQGNRVVKPMGGGSERALVSFSGDAAARAITDGVTEQAAGTTIANGLNYMYPSGARTAAVSGD